MQSDVACANAAASTDKGTGSPSLQQLLAEELRTLQEVLTAGFQRAVQVATQHEAAVMWGLQAELRELVSQNNRLCAQRDALLAESSLTMGRDTAGTGELSSACRSRNGPLWKATANSEVAPLTVRPPSPPRPPTTPPPSAPASAPTPEGSAPDLPPSLPGNVGESRVVWPSPDEGGPDGEGSHSLSLMDAARTPWSRRPKVPQLPPLPRTGPFAGRLTVPSEQDQPARQVSEDGLEGQSVPLRGLDLSPRYSARSVSPLCSGVQAWASPVPATKEALGSLKEEHVRQHGGPRNSNISGGDRSQTPHAVFLDAQRMKERVRRAVVVPEYSVTDYYYKTGTMQAIARHPVFENATLMMIAFNAIWMYVDTDWNPHALLSDAPLMFQVVEHTVCVYFVLELLVRFFSFAEKRNAFRDRWFVFDLILVLMMVTETWAMVIIAEAAGFKESGGLKNMSILRLIRIMRVARMARLVRLLRALPELMILLKGMAMAARSVCLTLALLTLIIYIYGITFSQMLSLSARNSAVRAAYFSTVPHSMKTLLLHGCFMEDLPDLVNAVGGEHLALAALLLSFVLLASLTVMNMLVGVLVEVVSVVAAVEKETLQVNFVKTKIQATLAELDANFDSMISRQEFETLLYQPVAAHALLEVGVDVIGLVDFSDVIFKDGDEISFHDFMDTVLQLRGSNMATVKDIVDLRKCVMQEIGRLEATIKPPVLKRQGPFREGSPMCMTTSQRAVRRTVAALTNGQTHRNGK
mmetsp:Transcript_17417/g.38096  ORF Transcript_17417/g.38096 Transcript_17417/m.38096 type:complete len:752 (-) Transcript_17417:229-2484(-)